ncbi:MAG TPA: hypothetical protein VMT96_00030 [Candidatus Bathyarchaeia archaeon]|nr:hypothetical protein [Candidatus Bathyarchaeia archaeon]
MGIGTISSIGLFLPLLMAPGNFAPQPQFVSGSIGTDVSYPNCNTTIPKGEFGTVGVTGGRADTLNPCLLKQAMTVRVPSLYVNTGWNVQADSATTAGPLKCAADDKDCLAYNYGYTNGRSAYLAAQKNWIHSNLWWLDVENSNTWSDDIYQNRSSLRGTFDALKNQGVRVVGVYSTTYQWDTLTGGWLTGWPTWGASIVATAKEAQSFCTDRHFTGGPSLLIQYLPPKSPVDLDYAC